MVDVELLGRAGCHLCDRARDELQALAPELGFTVRERSIEDDDELLRRYLERIPVVRVDGVDVCDHFVDRAALEAALGSLAP